MKKSRKLALLMLPILAAYIFQATQYARAPVKYNFYVVYAKNADIALVNGSDISPNGETLLQNTTAQEGLYVVSLGAWGPGYRVNYTDAFNITNNQEFPLRMIAFNFSSASDGEEFLRIHVYNDTNQDGRGDTKVCVWDGLTTLLGQEPDYDYIYFKEAEDGQVNGGTSRVIIEIRIPETGIDGLTGTTPTLTYEGTLYLWFSSA